MAKWTSMGHGMRRRIGAPSNHLESAGKSMARSNPTSDEAMAASGSSARTPMGMSAYAVTAEPALTGTLVPRKNGKAVDPVYPGSKGPGRTPVMDAGGERLGAAYQVKSFLGATIDPAAGATMANARIVPSVQGRNNPNFDSGNQAAYL
jgi:hypothetical protein